MKCLLYGFLIAVAYKLLNNLSLWLRTKYYSAKYSDYLADQKNNFVQYVPTVTNLFKIADLNESYFSLAEPVGFGYLKTANVPHFPNLAHRREDIVGATLRCFDQAQFVFKSRLIETFSPLYWIRTILFLPKQLFTFLGVSADSIFVKIMQVIYWIATPLLLAFRENIYQYISSLLG